MSAHRIVILGGGTGGTLVANRLQRRFGEQASITVVDRDDHHLYQPGLLFVPFGLAEPSELVRSRGGQLRDGIDFCLDAVASVELKTSTVRLASGAALEYDVLVIASGARLAPEETEGLVSDAWESPVHGFYTLGDACSLRTALEEFEGGRLVVNVIDMPIKCPVAPLEFCLLADWQLRERGIRDQVEVDVRHTTRWRLYQADRLGAPRRAAGRQGHPRGERVRHRQGRRRATYAAQLG